MPRRNVNCATCGKKIPQRDWADGHVVTSDTTKRSWCWRCTRRFIKKVAA